MSNETIASIQSIIKSMETEQFYKMETVEILACIIDEHTHSIDEDNPDEIIEALDTIEAGLGGDFTLDFDGNEYRIICDDCIWGIYRDEIQSIVEECYDLKFDSIPDFVAFEINWEQTAQNAYTDGYGHTFSGYDGSEHEAGHHWIFRTN